MTLAVTMLSTLVFLVALHFLRIIDIGRRVIDVAGDAGRTLRDGSIPDDEKEAAMQKASLTLAVAFANIAVRAVLTLALSLIPIFLADRLGWVPLDESISFMSRWDVILMLSAVIIAGYLVGPRLWRSK